MTTVLSVAQYNYLKGGSDTYRFGLDRLLAENGYEIVPFTARHENNVFSEWNEYFPPPVNFDSPGIKDIAQYVYSIPAANALKRLLDVKKIDIAHLHIYYGQLTSSILKVLKERDLPVVQTLHEYKVVCPTYDLLAGDKICTKCQGRHFWKAIVQRCNRGSVVRSALSAMESYVSRYNGAVKRIDHFIAVSHFQRRLLAELGIPSGKISTVHNFIDAKNVTPNFRPGMHFLYFGRLEKSKGLWTLVKAAEMCPESKLLIVGDGTQRKLLVEHLSKKSNTNIEYLGFKTGDELGKLISNSICTITPSEWYETFGLTILESFAHGRPVIASRIGGMQETITEGTDGMFIEPGDHMVLADTMRWFQQHKDEAVDMGKCGREKVLVEFAPEKHMASIREIYGRLR
jgi:glycosyltransferase involved in cell wall biosynthesis